MAGKPRARLMAVSPITRLGYAEIDQVIKAAGLPIAGDALRGKALYRTLKTLANWIVVHAMEAPRFPKKRARIVTAAFRRLQKVFHSDPYMPNSPPPIPADWLAAMEQWSEENTGASKVGANETWFDHFAYPRLLGFFYLAFSTEPTSTRNGPAHRFLAAFFKALKQDVSQHLLRDETPDQAIRDRVIEHCSLPKLETLRWKIRDHQPDPLWIGILLAEHEAELAKYDPPNGW